MFEQNPKTLGRTTSSWTHRLSFGELLTFQKAKLLEIIAGGHIWLKFGHFTFYTKLLDDNINMSALIEEMSWFCRFLFVVFTMSREPLLTKFSCVDAPPLKKLPKKQEEVSDKKPFPHDRLPATRILILQITVTQDLKVVGEISARSKYILWSPIYILGLGVRITFPELEKWR